MPGNSASAARMNQTSGGLANKPGSVSAKAGSVSLDPGRLFSNPGSVARSSGRQYLHFHNVSLVSPIASACLHRPTSRSRRPFDLVPIAGSDSLNPFCGYAARAGAGRFNLAGKCCRLAPGSRKPRLCFQNSAGVKRVAWAGGTRRAATGFARAAGTLRCDTSRHTTIPSPDAALGDGNGRSAAITTFLNTSPPSSKSLCQGFEDTPWRFRGFLPTRCRRHIDLPRSRIDKLFGRWP